MHFLTFGSPGALLSFSSLSRVFQGSSASTTKEHHLFTATDVKKSARAKAGLYSRLLYIVSIGSLPQPLPPTPGSSLSSPVLRPLLALKRVIVVSEEAARSVVQMNQVLQKPCGEWRLCAESGNPETNLYEPISKSL